MRPGLSATFSRNRRPSRAVIPAPSISSPRGGVLHPLPFLLRFRSRVRSPVPRRPRLASAPQGTFEPPRRLDLDGVALDLGASSHGTGCKSSLGIPQILIPATGPGRVLSPLHGPAPAGLPALLFMGGSLTAFHGVPLPYDLGLLGAPGCTLYNGPDIFLPFSPGRYHRCRCCPAPARPHNAPLHAQCPLGDTNANPAGATSPRRVWTFPPRSPCMWSLHLGDGGRRDPLPVQGAIAR